MQFRREEPNHLRTHTEIMALLTPREAKMLELFLAEPSETHIAKRIGMAPQTVRNHVVSLQKKLGVRSHAELMSVGLLAKLRDKLADPLD